MFDFCVWAPVRYCVFATNLPLITFRRWAIMCVYKMYEPVKTS